MKKIFLLILVMLCVSCAADAMAQDEPLFVAREGWKQGFINTRGEWVIEPVFDEVQPFTAAGYAAVVINADGERNPFAVIDRQGNVVAELPEWSLNIKYSYDDAVEQNAAENGFVLRNRENPDRYALYLAGTGKLIELNRDFLGYELSPDAEQNESNAYKRYSWEGTAPSHFCLSGWNGSLILQFCYNDYFPNSTGSISDRQHNVFIILDSQGNRLNDCFFVSDSDSGVPVPVEYSYQVTKPCMMVCDENTDSEYLISCDGKILLNDLYKSEQEDYDWEDDLQAFLLTTDEALLPDGQVMPFEERLKQQAALNPCGIIQYDAWYYDSHGSRITWPAVNEDDYAPLTAFSPEGVAWVECKKDTEYAAVSLINTAGQIVLNAQLHSRLYNQYKNNPESLPFQDGWECIEENRMYGYINASGEKLFGGCPFEEAEPFRNGLARIQFMDDAFESLDAYINPEGQVVWAEHGKQSEIQRWLDEGVSFSADNMTLEQANRAIVGEWVCTGGGEHLGPPWVFCENGTCYLYSGQLFYWKLLKNTTGDTVFWNNPQVVLVISADPADLDTRLPEEGSGIRFSDTETFHLAWTDSGSGYKKVAPGYWEHQGYQILFPDDFTIQAETYDFSLDTDWGYSDRYMTRRLDNVCENTDNIKQQAKCWIRMNVSPLLEVSPQNYDDFDLTTYGNFSIENVRITNMDSIGVYPVSYMVFASNPAHLWTDYESGETGSDLWYLEVLIDVQDRTDDEIDAALKSADVLVDIIVRNESCTSVIKDFPVDLSKISRLSCFDSNVEIILQDIVPADIPPDVIMVNYFIDDDEKIAELSQEYKCYRLHLAVNNNSARRIFLYKFSGQADQTWIMYYEPEFEVFIPCYPGLTTTLDNFYLITDRDIDPEQISASQFWPLKIRICNEVAGFINDYDESLLVRNGVPFEVLIRDP